MLYLAPPKIEKYLLVWLLVAVEDTSAELSKPIKLDLDNKNNSNSDDYAAFKDINNIKAIRVEDKGDFVLD